MPSARDGWAWLDLYAEFGFLLDGKIIGIKTEIFS